MTQDKTDLEHYEIKRWDNGSVIFAGGYRSFAECFIDAVNKKISFFRADFRYADFRSANFSSADFRYADFRYADFRSAKTVGIYFNYAIGDGELITSLQVQNYKIAIIGNICYGGCTIKSLDEWLDYDGDDLSGYDAKYLETVTKPFIKMVIAMREYNAD